MGEGRVSDRLLYYGTALPYKGAGAAADGAYRCQARIRWITLLLHEMTGPPPPRGGGGGGAGTKWSARFGAGRRAIFANGSMMPLRHAGGHRADSIRNFRLDAAAVEAVDAEQGPFYDCMMKLPGARAGVCGGVFAQQEREDRRLDPIRSSTNILKCGWTEVTGNLPRSGTWPIYEELPMKFSKTPGIYRRSDQIRGGRHVMAKTICGCDRAASGRKNPEPKV